MAAALASLDAVILCGGKGTRLQSILPDRPKGLAAVRGRAVLDILVDDLRAQGLRRIVLCVGHLGEQIVAHFNDRRDAEFVFSRETEPLGTGGAIRNAAPLIRSDPFLVMNGDSFCRIDLQRLLDVHREHAPDVTIALADPGQRRDAGTVDLAQDGRIRAFDEKPGGNVTRRYINAGIYLFARRALDAWSPGRPFSLEYDVFPRLVAAGRCYGYVIEGGVTDIGTPERYQRAQDRAPE